MMCCISSIGPDETNTETKNEACVYEQRGGGSLEGFAYTLT
jgi:hypothetical protein